MSEEIALASGDIAYWQRQYETEANRRTAIERALIELQGATLPEPNQSPHEEVWNRSRITLHTHRYYGPAGFTDPPIPLTPDEVSETQVLDDMARRLDEIQRALAVAMQENDNHHAYEKALESKFGPISRQIGEQNTTIGYQDAMLAELRRLLTAAYHALQSYARGNDAPALAEEVAARIEQVIEI